MWQRARIVTGASKLIGKLCWVDPHFTRTSVLAIDSCTYAMAEANFRAYKTNVTLNNELLPIDARCTELLPQFAEDVALIDLAEFIKGGHDDGQSQPTP